MQGKVLKPVRFVGSAHKDLQQFPVTVRRNIGFALHIAQTGGRADDVKIMHGFGGASVLEVVEDYETDAYRAVYTVRFQDAIYVLHAFKKKSKKGDATPKPDMNIIHSRLKDAEADYKKRHP